MENTDITAPVYDQNTEEYDNFVPEAAQTERNREAEEEAALLGGEQDQGFLPNNPLQLATEATSALVGGAADAVESVGGFLDLSGDTIKTGLNKAFGNPIDETQNPWSNQYESNNPLDIPDEWIPENKSGLGKLARGLAEFGFLTAATGGVGGAAFGSARVGLRVAATARATGIGIKGVRSVKFVTKLTKIASEGAIADLVSTSSEAANVANLVQEHAPWLPFPEALAIDPDKDSAWTSRLKTVAAGAGINLVGHFLAAFIKGSYRAVKARKAGKTIEEANIIGNNTVADEMQLSLELDERAGTELAAENFADGKGITNANLREDFLAKHLDEDELAARNNPDALPEDIAALDDIANERGASAGDPWDAENAMSYNQSQTMKSPDPLVNPKMFNDSEKSTYRPDNPDDAVKQNLRESIADMKRGGEGRSYNPLFTESALKRMSRGNKNIRQYILEVSKDLSNSAFRDLDVSLDFKEVQALVIRQADEMYGLLEEGGEAAVQRFKEYFKKGEDGIEWTHDGSTIVTGTASQKMALQLVINTLAKQVEAIATGALDLPRGVPLTRQTDQIFDAMKVALTEHKKVGFMTGLELRRQKGDVLSFMMKKEINQGLADIAKKQDEYFDTLKTLGKEGKIQQRRDLIELHQLSGGKVRTLEHIHTYLEALLKGGRMDGVNLTGRWRTEARSVFYNSILSSLKTPIKAIAGTNMIAMLRPFQAALGAFWSGDKKEMMLAMAQIDAIGKGWAESFDMFKHNWDLGVNRKTQSYVGKFDFEKDIEQWKGMGEFYKKYGNDVQQNAYDSLDWIVDLNNNPWMRYSANGMGAGDALARTIIGRMNMRVKAARAALESGVDLDNVRAWADKHEELFRKDIFKKDQYGKYIVSDKATKLAGDEAAMTSALEGNLQGFEKLAQGSGMRAFFPFVRTGFNALGLSFQHTELARFSDKFHDIMNGQNLAKYGINNADELASAQNLMRGRMAMGNSIVGMASIAALSGNMTGTMPADKETRDLWRQEGIQPESFKFGNVYVSYRDIEPFNTLFAATANVMNYQHVLGEDLRDEFLGKITFMLTSVIVDKSMLAGVEDLAKVMSADSNMGSVGRIGAKFVRSHLPYAGLLAQVGTLMDANAKEANTFWEQIIQRDAVFKSGLAPKYDILSKDRSGKPFVTPANPLLRFFNAFSPIAINYVDADPVKMGLTEMNYNLPEVMATYKGVRLNSLERSELQKYMSMGTLRKDLEHLMRKNGRWRKGLNEYKNRGLREADGFKLTEQQFYQDVHRIFIRAKREAIGKMLTENPEIAKKILERGRLKAISGSGNYSRIDYLINEFPN
jgi:hypothetical protein